MASMSRVVALVLGQVGGEIGKGLAEGIAGHFDDPSQALPEAIRRAYARSWQVIELALSGEDLGGRLRLALASGEVRGVVAPVGRILADRGPEMRSACLRELKEARDRRALGPDLAAPTQDRPLQRLADPQGFLEAAWGAVRDLAVGLHRAGYVHLAQLVGTRIAGQPPLLVTAFGYFLRREVADDPRLAAGLNFELLERLWQGQEAGFGRLGEDLARWGGALQEGLKQVGGALAAVDAQVGETREAVLDLRRLTEVAQGEARALADQVLGELQRLGAARGAVRPGLSLTLRGDAERQLVRQLIARYRALPEGAQGQVPALLNALGKLDLAAGETSGAAGLFAEVADQVAGDAPALAEARYNQFRAALEGRDWAGALEALGAAAGLDPGRFAPFPLRKYEPLSILGAGAFGVVYLCRHRHVDAPVVIKSLHAEGLGQGIAQIFREGRLLKGLNHPAVVRVEDCDYADAEGQSRPYLVMEHFEGEDLDLWLRRHGPLAAAELPGLARPLAAGMQAAHACGVLHRDLKPANLLVRRNGGWHLKIIDFGLALRQDPEAPGATRAPAAGTTDPAGTLQFAPPEQLGLRPEAVGPYSDVYAFGKTLVYCLFRRTELLRRDWRALEAEAPGLAGLLERCLEDDPAERLQGFGPVLEALDGLVPQVQGAPRPPAPTPAPPTPPPLARAPVAGPVPAVRGWALPPAPAPAPAPTPAPTAAPLPTPAAQGWARPAPGSAQGPAAVGPAGWGELACLGQVRTLTKPVAGLAFSPDGGRLYAGLHDGSIRLCPVVGDGSGVGGDWGPLKPPSGGSTGALAVTADGGRLLARQLGAVAVYNSTDGSRAANLAVGGSHQLTAYALDPASGVLVTADWDKRLLVWDLASGARVRECLGHTGPLLALALVPGGGTAISAGDTSIRGWDLASGAELWCIDCRGGVPGGLLLTPDGATLVALFGGPTQVCLYDLATRTRRACWAGRIDAASSLLTPDGTGLLVGGWDGQIRLYDLASATLLGTLAGHTAPVTALALSPDGVLLASAGEDCSVRTWDLASGEPRSTPGEGHTGPVQALALSPDGASLASGGMDRTVRLWDLAGRRQTGTLGDPKQHWVRDLAYSPDGARLAWCTINGPCVWDLRGSVRLMQHFKSPLWALAWAGDGGRLATLIAGDASTAALQVWDPVRQEIVSEVRLPPFPQALALTGDGRRAFIGCEAPEGKTVRACDLGGEPDPWTWTYPGWARIAALALAPDGARLAVADTAGHIFLVCVADARLERELVAAGPIAALRFTPAGDRLLAAGQQGALLTYDPQDGTLVRVLTGHQGPINALAVGPGGDLVVSGGDDGTLRLWGADAPAAV